MNRRTAFLASALSACSILMGAAPLAHAQSYNCTSDPCGAEYSNIPINGLSPDYTVSCSSAAPGSCSNSGDFTDWRAQIYPSAVRLLNNAQVGLPVQISSGDVGWCYAYAYDLNGGVTSDFAFYPGSCNVTLGHIADTQIFFGVGKTPSLPQTAPEQLGRLQNAYTGNGTYYIGIPGGPSNGTVSDNAHLIVWTKSQFDQLWVIPPGGGAIYDVYKDPNRSHVCLHAASYSQGAAITDAACDTNPQATDPLSVWQIIGSNKLGDPHPGCFILYSPYTGYAIGVAGGNGNVKNGGSLVQWAYDGSANQFWCEK